MSADLNSFEELFKNFTNNVAGNPPGQKIPAWVKYVDIKAGDSLDNIIPTAFQMHAAVTGKKLISNSFKINCSSESIQEIQDDVSSKVPIIFSNKTYADYHLNDFTFCRVHAHHDRDFISISLYTFDETFSDYLEKNINYHLDKEKNGEVETVK